MAQGAHNVKTFYINNESIIATLRNLRQKFGRNNVPSVNITVRQWMRKFEQNEYTIIQALSS